MSKFVIDEDLPRSTGPLLKKIGHEVYDIRDCGLRGSDDAEIFRFAVTKKSYSANRRSWIWEYSDLSLKNPFWYCDCSLSQRDEYSRNE